MPATALDPSLHAACLQSAVTAVTDDQKGRHTAVFLVLRVVDLFADSESADAISYQLDATEKQLCQLLTDADAPPLMSVLRAAHEANRSGDCAVLWPPLISLGMQLEADLLLAESLDTLDTVLRLPGIHRNRALALSRRGRTLRLAGCLQESLDSYAAAITLATDLGELEIALRARIGSAETNVRKGNLPAAEETIRTVLATARLNAKQHIEARAQHTLALVHSARGDHSNAILDLYRSYHLHTEKSMILRVVSDMGMAFKDLGHLEASRDCFEIFLAGEISDDMRLNAELELIELAALRGDRDGFERLRREVGAVCMPPDTNADFFIKSGKGLALFGDRIGAAAEFRKAIEIAELHDLNTYLFHAESCLADTRDCKPPERTETTPDGWLRPEVRSVAEDLRQVRQLV